MSLDYIGKNDVRIWKKIITYENSCDHTRKKTDNRRDHIFCSVKIQTHNIEHEHKF